MPQHKRGPWSQTEDAYLMSLVQVHGAHNWVRISQSIGTRSPKQCRERYHQNLKPNLNHDPISIEEGMLIEQMVAEMGKRWAEIARRLRGRSDNAVKNWWNGGMNRRRRYNNRRTELEVRQQLPCDPVRAASGLSIATHHQQHPLPTTLPHQQPQQQSAMHPQHFFPQSLYQPSHAPVPQPIRLPSNGPPLRMHNMIETPLPSPSAFSSMSAEGAPSLISDTSSTSTRSPHNGVSPIELPPLSGARHERRQSSGPMQQLGAPGSFVQDSDFQLSTAPFSRFAESEKTAPAPRMLQEPFMPHSSQQHHFIPPPPQHFLPSHARNTTPLPSQPAHHVSEPLQHPLFPTHQQHAISSYQPHAQLPGISSLQPPPLLSNDTSAHIDAVRRTPMATPLTLEGSPKDKMSLSNLTH